MAYKIKRYIVKAVMVFLALACCSGCGPSRVGYAPELLESVVIGASTLKVDRGDLARMQQLRGTVRVRSDRLSFMPANLRFGEFLVKVGDRVTEGQPLAKLDTSEIEDRIEAQQEYIDQLIEDNEHENALSQIDIDIRQAEIGSMNPQAVAWSRLLLEQSMEFQELALSEARESLEILSKAIDDSVLRAPYDGVITWLADKEFGDFVEPYAGIAYISAEDEIYIELTEHVFYFGSLDIESIICRVGNSEYELSWIPPDSQEVVYYTMMLTAPPVRFRVHEPDYELYPGRFASVILYFSLVDDVVRVPLNCVYGETRTDAYVYVLQDGRKVIRQFEMGLRGNVYAEVISGLEVGDEVFVKR